MQIVIDGYNLLKYALKARDVSQKQKETFIALLNRYAALKKNQLLIFFDGGQTIWPEREMPYELVTVVHVGKGTTADQVILEYLQKHKQRPLVLVSSDRQLKNAALNAQATSLESADFWQLVSVLLEPQQKSHTHSIAHKTTKTSKHEIDVLMQEAKVVSKKDDEPRSYDKSDARSKSTSKIERATARIVKKL